MRSAGLLYAFIAGTMLLSGIGQAYPSPPTQQPLPVIEIRFIGEQSHHEQVIAINDRTMLTRPQIANFASVSTTDDQPLGGQAMIAM